ncbi:hypothetical protein HanPI659440_Chr13g0491691 [Helianthus annuus]|nr:hypothetical protein HanPI659440_Chr13g0491691 [Helianthus annuus]
MQGLLVNYVSFHLLYMVSSIYGVVMTFIITIILYISVMSHTSNLSFKTTTLRVWS